MYMKVFISWSGETSRAVATALRDWIPNVLQYAQPWVSSHDIPSGRRWSHELGLQLQDMQTGILCLTSDNLASPWILFEAGALSKALNDSLVCPYLFRLESTVVEWPLAQFEWVKADKVGTEKLLETINNNATDASRLTEARLAVAFEKWWPELQQNLENIPITQPVVQARPEGELIKEILETVRQLNIRSTNALPIQRPRWEPSEAQKAAALEAARAAPKVLELLSARAVPMFSSAIASELNISEAAAMDALRLLEQRGEAVNDRDAMGRRYVTWIAKKD
jgi:hypothetical protein